MKIKNLVLYFLLFLSSLSVAKTITGTVVSIHDGDTLRINSSEIERVKSVRFLGIDTPEVDFQGVSQGDVAFMARDYLRSLVPIGAQVVVDVGNTSLNRSRLLGKVIYKGKDIGKEMVVSGYAAPYFIYPFEKRMLFEYLEAAKLAQSEKSGVMSFEAEMPYEFRMRVKGFDGTNYVGDFFSKKLFLPTEVNLVPYTNRVFFKYVEDAERLGYSLN